MTPLQRVVSTPKGQLKNPYADFTSVAEEGQKIYRSFDCNGCHGGGGMAAPSRILFGFMAMTTTRCSG
jgi:mono/diheme cytochrome c family protein